MEPGCTSPRLYLRADATGEGSLSGDGSLWSFSCKMWVRIFHRFPIIIFLAMLSVDADLTTPLSVSVDNTAGREI